MRRVYDGVDELLNAFGELANGGDPADVEPGGSLHDLARVHVIVNDKKLYHAHIDNVLMIAVYDYRGGATAYVPEKFIQQERAKHTVYVSGKPTKKMYTVYRPNIVEIRSQVRCLIRSDLAIDDTVKEVGAYVLLSVEPEEMLSTPTCSGLITMPAGPLPEGHVLINVQTLI